MAEHRAEPRAGSRPNGLLPQQGSSITTDAAGAGRIVHYRSQDGLHLAARIFDSAADRLPLLCLPGLSRNSRDFLALGRHFSNHSSEPRRVVALDYRGRGFSDPSPDWRSYTPLTEAHDVLAAAAALGIEEAVIVGTSRGGIIAMLLAAIRPALIAGVVLNDIGPVIEGIGLARIKRYLSARRAIATWDDALVSARDIAGSTFPALTEADWRAFTEAYYLETPQGLRPHFDPDLIRILEGTDFSEKIPDLWPQFMGLSRVRVLAIRGELSDLLSTRTLDAMAERHLRFEQMTVPGQGHAPLLRDAVSLERIAALARSCDSAPTD